MSGKLTTPEQTECETYRVVVLGQSGTEVLVVPDGDRFALPSVNIPCWQRVAENLTAAVKTDWGEEVVCLFEPDASPGTNGAGTRYQATEHWSASGHPKMPTQWVPASALAQECLIDCCDYLAIRQSLTECGAEARDSSVEPFARLGCFKELREWVQTVIEPSGFHLNEKFRQLNASPSFSLIRFETDGPAVWFKAVGEPNQREFAITCLLSRLFPSRVPCVLAPRPEWNGWLTREAEGELLCNAQEIRTWQRVAAQLAELQINSYDQASGILAAGARDLRVATLSKQIRHFVDTTQQLMQQQLKTPPSILEPKELLLLGEHIRAAFDVVGRSRMTDTLGHLDFNPGNVVVSLQSCVFLDWAEAYVGNPFLTFQYLLEHFRRKHGNDSSQESELVESYVAPWLRIASREAIAAILDVSPLLAVFSYACGTGMLSDDERLKDAEFAGYLRGLARRMDREARTWADRSSKCVTQVLA